MDVQTVSSTSILFKALLFVLVRLDLPPPKTPLFIIDFNGITSLGPTSSWSILSRLKLCLAGLNGFDPAILNCLEYVLSLCSPPFA